MHHPFSCFFAWYMLSNCNASSTLATPLISMQGNMLSLTTSNTSFLSSSVGILGSYTDFLNSSSSWPSSYFTVPQNFLLYSHMHRKFSCIFHFRCVYLNNRSITFSLQLQILNVVCCWLQVCWIFLEWALQDPSGLSVPWFSCILAALLPYLWLQLRIVLALGQISLACSLWASDSPPSFPFTSSPK